MLKHNTVENRLSSGLRVVSGGLDTARGGQTGFLQHLRQWIISAWKEHKCRSLHRYTEREIAKLNDQIRHDIGWPARYDPRESCRRMGH
ncbi:hypothetical protein [Hoeflea prorocentri]|uniref:Uncharacterized protein n=1 Tax=Hoeflea prorocentri TaxID=1922333 RepID=A0A9X3ZFS8_9HYPH|nr:hypothetical protein [Hoeflea prorocentri]MCY6380037.1 hypothetical protein [Hoeflea prorocentri]MDA5397837.1 hypothetical protein [Hoeflea prorocentri]